MSQVTAPERKIVLPEQPPAAIEERRVINHYLNGQIRVEARIARLAMTLNEHLGKNILQICPHRYNPPNNCAHWVSHVLGYDRIGCPTCKSLSTTKSARDIGVLIRVDEIYNAARQRTGFTNAFPAGFHQGLVYVTRKSNMKPSGDMKNGSSKHIGIWHANKVWHYSNTGNRVAADTLQRFQKVFTAYYGGGGSHPVVFFCSDFRGNFQ